eukprot:SAG31_NODE_40738_length_279_cov_0.850000_1_plen_50_part_01
MGSDAQEGQPASAAARADSAMLTHLERTLTLEQIAASDIFVGQPRRQSVG